MNDNKIQDYSTTLERLRAAVRVAIGLRDPFNLLLADTLWQELSGSSIPPYDRTAAIQAAVASGLPCTEAARHWDIPAHLVQRIVRPPK